MKEVRESIGTVTPETPGFDHIFETHAKSSKVPGKSLFGTDDPKKIARILNEAVHSQYAVVENFGEQTRFRTNVDGHIIAVKVRRYDDGHFEIWTGYDEDGKRK